MRVKVNPSCVLWSLLLGALILGALHILTRFLGTQGIGGGIIWGYVQQNVSTGMLRALMNMLEGTLEMVGAILAAYAFLLYLRHISPVSTIELVGSGAAR